VNERRGNLRFTLIHTSPRQHVGKKELPTSSS
jgi:hypothetical protein